MLPRASKVIFSGAADRVKESSSVSLPPNISRLKDFRARVVRLAAEPGEVALLLGFLLELEIVLGRTVLILLLLLVVLVGLLSLGRDGPQRRRAIFGE